MAFLIDQIKEQKFLEMEVDFNNFIIDNKISESAMIHTMTFDKEVFKEETEVREYLKGKYLWDPAITQNDKEFIVGLLSQSQMDMETEINVIIRRGVTIFAANLLPVMSFEEISFNEKGEINLSSKFGTIDLSGGLPHIIEIARVAEGTHPSYGAIKITQENLESFEKNFNSNVTGVDLAVNEDHKKNEAFGWLKDVFLSYDKQTLMAQVNWNTKGTTALSEKEYRYFSPELRFNYVHPMTGVEHGATLLGGALTNYPFLKMEAITELNHKPEQEGTKVKTEQIDLSVHTEKVVDLSTKLSAAQVELSAKTTENTVLAEKVKTLEATIELNAKKQTHEKLFNDGHINKVQLDAMNEGKGMLEVMALNTKSNNEAQGTGAAPKDEVNLNDTQKSVAETFGLTDEEFKNTNI